MQYIIYPLGEDSLVYVCTIILTDMHLSNFFYHVGTRPVKWSQESCNSKEAVGRK